MPGTGTLRVVAFGMALDLSAAIHTLPVDVSYVPLGAVAASTGCPVAKFPIPPAAPLARSADPLTAPFPMSSPPLAISLPGPLAFFFVWVLFEEVTESCPALG
jgi:hypothetical protein